MGQTAGLRNSAAEIIRSDERQRTKLPHSTRITCTTYSHTLIMAALISRRLFSTSTRRFQSHVQDELRKETKQNPELWVRATSNARADRVAAEANIGPQILGGVMVAALGGAGFYFGRSPTGATSETRVTIAKDGMPWEGDSSLGKYKYHPGGDITKEPKEAPSALNVVVVPGVTLPKELHDKYNKWGKDGYP
ncbi:hypothetical protein DCS_02052 [Drechmeria coniospora]|uniref:Uncharacterized protein n=1 Tax=Drechmeria coniospora TaxID=98403 RepID=A0A151GV59_DRECN|nr:hypothetical protein DCS_02052 [Drechmeria coniospora]KYK60912.1 hypothetical protein DCS_02052 [Drechmeria coniospora]